MISRRVSIFISLLLCTSFLFSQDFRTINQSAFKRGESLQYKVYWDTWMVNVRAGIATITITKERKKFNDRSTFHIIGTGRSTGMLDLFHKVRDRFESYIDEEALIPWFFIRRTKEGSYVRNDDVVFKHQYREAISRYSTKSIPENVQDIVSAFYYARTFDFANVSPGDVFPFDFYLDDSVYVSKVVFEGRDTVKIDIGTFACLKFKPMVLVGDVFKEPYPMTLWVTDDRNMVPVLAQSAIIVGTVKVELIAFEGLSNPLTSKIY
ncbi:MAG: DUF3108 domain-containing protein [Bacteroidetes bacterium]|nr:DUF3108 domain-containing protein [Bacteroidota bacterium]